MKCPRCKTIMIYEPPCYQGDIPAARCVACGHYIWKPVMPVMPTIPPFEAQGKAIEAPQRRTIKHILADRKAKLEAQLEEIKRKECQL